ncbi:MAG: hypothetical protein RLZZ609_652 [Cyanobacteriota bacterium]|jgi:hypothetical protein
MGRGGEKPAEPCPWGFPVVASTQPDGDDAKSVSWKPTDLAQAQIARRWERKASACFSGSVLVRKSR